MNKSASILLTSRYLRNAGLRHSPASSISLRVPPRALMSSAWPLRNLAVRTSRHQEYPATSTVFVVRRARRRQKYVQRAWIQVQGSSAKAQYRERGSCTPRQICTSKDDVGRCRAACSFSAVTLARGSCQPYSNTNVYQEEADYRHSQRRQRR